jgi:hypothetical protein
MVKWLMIYLVYELELELYGGIMCNSSIMQKGSDSTKGSCEGSFIFIF